MNCTDCHGNSAGRGTSTTGQPNGPHSSPSAPLLVRPLLGTSAGDVASLCYTCHSFEIYGDGSADGQTDRSSGFVDAGSGAKLHSSHTARGYTCQSCHVSHGAASEPFGLRDDVGWAADVSGKGEDRAPTGVMEGPTSPTIVDRRRTPRAWGSLVDLHRSPKTKKPGRCSPGLPSLLAGTYLMMYTAVPTGTRGNRLSMSLRCILMQP